jgi:peptide/nickel transport system substrate-binding protein
LAIRIGLGAPPKVNAGSGLENIVSFATTETWLTSQQDGRLGDKIASAWRWDEAGTTLRLTLRNDVYFHDGTLLTPELAAEALRRSVADVRRRPSSFSSVRSVSALGTDGIEIKLSEPNSFFLPDLSLASVMKPGQSQVGTGPFRVVRADKQQAVLQAFDKHYRDRPGFAEVDIRNYPTQRNAWAALMRGEIDALYEVGRGVTEFVQADSTIKMYTFPRPYYNTLVFNERHPVLKSSGVRRAINEALDRATLIRDGLNGQGNPADGPLLPDHWAYSPPPQQFEFNPAAARLRFDNAGLRIRPGAGGRMPSRFSFTCLVFADDPRFERLAVLVAKQLADVGIDMRLEPLPVEQFVPRLGSGDFDAFLFEMAGRSLGWVYQFWHSNDRGMVKNGYVSADAVLDRIRGARTDDEIRRGVTELQRILHDDPPAAFLAWQTTSRAVSTKIDVAQEPGRDVLSNIWKWRPAGSGPVPR